MRGRNDDGVALILTLLLMMILSAVAVSLIFLSNTETYASMNYRLMSQARYGAESGVHKAMNYLFNGYSQPGSAGDPLSNYNMLVSPVTYNGAPVVLSALASKPSNYPSAATVTAFHNAATGSLSVGGYNVQYGAYATLMSMETFTVYGSGALGVVQTWRITADGTIGGARPAQVEVSAMVEQQKVPINTFGVFATNPNCGALSFGGGETTDSYDSASLNNGQPVISLSNGDVGTNGNLTMNGNATVNGTLNTPRTGVGHCQNGAVNALTQNGQATVTQGIVSLPQALTYPTPAPPSPLPPTSNVSLAGNANCASVPLSLPSTCVASGSSLTIMPNGGVVSLGNIKLTGGQTLHLQAGTYNVNSLSLAGNSTVVIDEPPAVPSAPAGAVVFNVAGQGVTTPIDFSGGSLQNPSYKPENLAIMYAGTGNITVSGGTASSAMVFAPNANISLVGGSDFYGEILGSTVTDSGGTRFHYDRSLKKKGVAAGNYMLSAFTWKKY
jgi:Tfp pilus assembly protein PilX